MVPIAFAQASRDCAGTYTGNTDTVITGVVSDTRRIGSGGLFARKSIDETYQAAVREGIECHSVLQTEEAYNLLCSMTADNDTLLLKGSNGSGIWKIADLFFGKD